MKKNQKIKKFLVLLLSLAMLISFIPLSVSAGIEETVVATTEDYGLADVENLQVYALQNVGSGKWASTSVNNATYFYIWNVFQTSSWTNSAQNFKFIKTDVTENTYIIYPLEYNNYNSSETRALSCRASKAEEGDAIINVTYSPYSERSKENFEWIVEQVDNEEGNIHNIRLKADPTYVLTVNGTASGNDNGSAITADGNMVVQKTLSSNSDLTDFQKWKFTYVIKEGEYYIKNRFCHEFLTTTGVFQSDVYTSSDLSGDMQKWNITHIHNGLYNIGSSIAYDATLAYGMPINGDNVYVETSMVHTNNWWRFERLEGGTFKISNALCDQYNVDYALQSYQTTVTPHAVVHGSYFANIARQDEWFLIPTDGIYGMQTFYDVDNSLVDCYGYALHISTKSDEWCNVHMENAKKYCFACTSKEEPPEGYMKIDLQNSLEKEFLTWHNQYFSVFFPDECSISVVHDNDFENGIVNVMAPNQYRVALNTGMNMVTVDGQDICFSDFHFWFQTYTGQWAHKLADGIPELLDYGITPMTKGTSGWYNEMIDFYDQEPAIFIITIMEE